MGKPTSSLSLCAFSLDRPSRDYDPPPRPPKASTVSSSGSPTPKRRPFRRFSLAVSLLGTVGVAVMSGGAKQVWHLSLWAARPPARPLWRDGGGDMLWPARLCRPREAMDPHQRILLETAYESFYNGGFSKDAVGRIRRPALGGRFRALRHRACLPPSLLPLRLSMFPSFSGWPCLSLVALSSREPFRSPGPDS